MRNNLLEAIIGAVVLVLAGFFLFYAYSAGQKSVPKGYVVYAKFDRIDGLNAGADVKISGVKVGIVQKLEIDPDTYQAKVGMMVRNDIKIPKDSSSEIASESLLGGKYIAIVPGGSEEFLTPNGSINHTQSSISFEGLISKFLFSNKPSSEEAKKEEAKAA